MVLGASTLTKLLPSSLSLCGDSLELVTSVAVAIILPSGLTGYHPALTVTHSSTDSHLPLYLILLRSFFVLMPRLSVIWPLGVAFVHVSLAFGTFSAFSRHSLTSCHHRMVLVSAWSQPFLQGLLVPFSRGWNLETGIWVFKYSLCTGVLLFLGPFSSQTCTHTTHTHHTHTAVTTPAATCAHLL